jgi:hypothetical protein
VTDYNVNLTSDVADDVIVERVHQVEAGFTPDHDDEHGLRHLIKWAKWYADCGVSDVLEDHLGVISVKEAPHREKLVQAAALLVAAIEYVDRAENREDNGQAKD